jgi:hypothetical protein
VWKISRVLGRHTTDVRLDGDEMTADADDGDACHFLGTYMAAGRLSTPAEVGDIIAIWRPKFDPLGQRAPASVT